MDFYTEDTTHTSTKSETCETRHENLEIRQEVRNTSGSWENAGEVSRTREMEAAGVTKCTMSDVMKFFCDVYFLNGK